MTLIFLRCFSALACTVREGSLQAWFALLLRDSQQWNPEREETEKSDFMDAHVQRILAEKWGNDTAGWFLLFADVNAVLY